MWLAVGYLYWEVEEKEKAFFAYTKAISLKPNFAEAYNNRGLTRSGLNQHKAAIADYNTTINLNHIAIDLNPSYVETYNNRGLAKVGIGEYEARYCRL